MDLAHVLWIGGGQGSGKSTTARALSRRFGYRLYNVDHRTYDHLARGAESAVAGLTPDEQWIEPTVDELVERLDHSCAERFELVLADLRSGPLEPVVVEGPQLLPRLVADIAAPRCAVYLVAPEAEQRAALAARGGFHRTSDPGRALANRIERDVAFAKRVADDARALGVPVVERDAPVEEILTRVNGLIDLPDGLGRDGLRRARREENEALVRQLVLYRASGEVPPEHLDRPVRFACECGAPGCAATVEVPLDAYDVQPVLAH